MKITANQIQAGMKIRIAGVKDHKSDYVDYSTHPNFKSQHAKYKFLVENNLTKSVSLGAIKKSSPTVTVQKVDFSNSWSYMVNNRKITFNSIYIHTELGVLEIGNRQKVELV